MTKAKPNVRKKPSKPAPPKAAEKLGKNMEAFRAQYDKSYLVPNSIRQALGKLGDDNWEHEGQFIRLCGLSVTDFARYREQFKDYYVIVDGSRSGKRIWAGSKRFADKLRTMV